MLREVLRYLRPSEGDIVADCTLGYGGHAERICRRIGPTGRLIGLDIDADQLRRTEQRLAPVETTIHYHHASYAHLDRVLASEGVDGCDAILADLGVSSMQVDDPGRGVSYAHEDAPLDMRMDRTQATTAAELLATMPAEDLSAAFDALGDEPDHAKIAEWIVRQRQVAPLERNAQLIRLIFDAKGLSKKTWRKAPSTRHGRLHPAARVFQALRILVNDELANVGRLLEILPQCLAPGGRAGIISFHSGEDRLVKQAFKAHLASGVYQRGSSKVLTPRPAEVGANPRAASAKFRWVQAAGPDVQLKPAPPATDE